MKYDASRAKYDEIARKIDALCTNAKQTQSASVIKVHQTIIFNEWDDKFRVNIWKKWIMTEFENLKENRSFHVYC